ncbi:Sir2 family protein [Giardia muris]|uniref:Sir2 family protein n=1 Tax=Giardia muris TaxID=5742 RepID=A0A4Z1T616_GIAMU|nr:Sir2 family protein [Giardia muris]|eukprot:TNJ27901.1 Sir2 family protein [Giardia muris]
MSVFERLSRPTTSPNPTHLPPTNPRRETASLATAIPKSKRSVSITSRRATTARQGKSRPQSVGTAILLSQEARVSRIEAKVARSLTLIEDLAYHIERSNYILLGVGAGFSADSGLAVYRDIAKFPAYERMGVDYADLCDPVWLRRNPDVFYGFWGHCYNAYRETEPHLGYTIVRRLVEKYPEKRFFIYSSNVDSHFEKIGVSRELIYEFHGTCMDWQCARSCKAGAIFRLPFEHRFNIDERTMHCPSVGRVRPFSSTALPSQVRAAHYVGNGTWLPLTQPSASSLPNLRPHTSTKPTLAGALERQGIDLELIRKAARTITSTGERHINSYEASGFLIDRQDPREQKQRTAPTAPPKILTSPPPRRTTEEPYRQVYERTRRLLKSGTVDSHPLCPDCGYYLRPRVLMFNDDLFIELCSEEEQYTKFRRRLLKEKDAKVCLLELGCGLRIPTVRHELEGLLSKCSRTGIPAAMFRVNTDGRSGRSSRKAPPQNLFSITMGGLNVLERVGQLLGLLDTQPSRSSTIDVDSVETV